ncbi:MAG: hypothetical protein EOP10_12005 [Proteobacteria bacterium]|nr:MAG: hypothetical protein EOP10_12005 [Pseudomonadota bacterium]
MQTSRLLALGFTIMNLSLAPIASAKEHKKADKTKLSKECTEKGGTWNAKRKKCALPDAKTEAAKPSTSEEPSTEQGTTPSEAE